MTARAELIARLRRFHRDDDVLVAADALEQMAGEIERLKYARDQALDKAARYGERADTLRAQVEALRKDAARYRWLRDEDVGTDPRYYPFWQEFQYKLCREEKMDALIDRYKSEGSDGYKSEPAIGGF